MNKNRIHVCIDDDSCSFEYPARPDYFSDTYYDALELMNVCRYAEAETILRDLVETIPDHIDAMAHLAMTLKEKGHHIESLALAEYAVRRGKTYLPENFDPQKHKLPYGILDNRGYLRACHFLGIQYLERDRFKEALSIFKELLLINPGDNQGIRELAVKCYFELNIPQEIVSLCADYQDDTTPAIRWGQVIALYKLNKEDEATQAITKALKWTPKVGKELLKKKHPKPKDLNKFYETQGGDDQAYNYWTNFGKYWQETPGSLDFLKYQIKK